MNFRPRRIFFFSTTTTTRLPSESSWLRVLLRKSCANVCVICPETLSVYVETKLGSVFLFSPAGSSSNFLLVFPPFLVPPQLLNKFFAQSGSRRRRFALRLHPSSDAASHLHSDLRLGSSHNRLVTLC